MYTTKHLFIYNFFLFYLLIYLLSNYDTTGFLLSPLLSIRVALLQVTLCFIHNVCHLSVTNVTVL